MPYANTNSDVLVAAGQAGYGTTDEPGKTFGAFGVPMEAVFNDSTIADADGKPTDRAVTLSTDVYDALRSGQVDWAIPRPTPATTRALVSALVKGCEWAAKNRRLLINPDWLRVTCEG